MNSKTSQSCLLPIMLLTIVSTFFTGCSIISSNYVASSGIQRPHVSPNDVQVYYEKQDVPFKYKEIGRIFLKNINYWADRDPAGQISKIKKEAAESGADAVIIVSGERRESSFFLMDGTAGGNAGDVFQYSGIAIIRE